MWNSANGIEQFPSFADKLYWRIKMEIPQSTKPIDILLVEDNVGDIRLTQEALREGKILVNLAVARDGIEAMDFLQRRNGHADAVRPDLVLLDLNLPKKDGRQVLAEIKSDPELKSIPVVVLTTSAAETDILGIYGAHANCYITKPVDMDSFIRIVKVLEEFWFTVVKLPSHEEQR
jgi:CheY-like chemotaxis protein